MFMILELNLAEIREFLIEDKANGSAIISSIESSMSIPIIPINPTSSKESRVSSVAPIIESGRVFLPNINHPEHKHKQWMTYYLSEWGGFPNTKHDDCVDAARPEIGVEIGAEVQ